MGEMTMAKTTKDKIIDYISYFFIWTNLPNIWFWGSYINYGHKKIVWKTIYEIYHINNCFYGF